MNNVEVKIVLLGKVGVGKTWLVERYMNNRCSETNMTIGAAFSSKHLDINGKTVKLNIWDTAGAERFEAMAKSYYRGAGAAIVCYDITDFSSLEKVWFWIKELQDNVENCKIYFCGTKKDVVDEQPDCRQISYKDLEHHATATNAGIIETSSKTGENVRYLFNKIAEDYVTIPQTDKILLQSSLSNKLHIFKNIMDNKKYAVIIIYISETEELVEDLLRVRKKRLKCCKMA